MLRGKILELETQEGEERVRGFWFCLLVKGKMNKDEKEKGGLRAVEG